MRQCSHMEAAPDNSLIQELDAMAALGQVLGNLTDPTARQRVLKWAAERFAVDMATGVQPMAEPVTPADHGAIDPALALGSLDDMFPAEFGNLDGDLDVLEKCGEPSGPETPKPPIEAVLRSFAADFQRFTEEWNGANA